MSASGGLVAGSSDAGAARRASIRGSITNAASASALPERRGSVGQAARRASISLNAAQSAGSMMLGNATPGVDENDDGNNGGGKKGRRKSFVDAPSDGGGGSNANAKASGGSGGAPRRDSTFLAPKERRGSAGAANERRGSVSGAAGKGGVETGVGAIGTAARERRGSAAAGMGKVHDVAARGGLASIAGTNQNDGFSVEYDVKSEAEQKFNEMRVEQVRKKRQEEQDVDVMTTRAHGLLTRLRDGHKLGVYACHWADDGSHLASSSHDGSIVVWDVDATEVKRTYMGHAGPVFQVQFSPIGDNDRLISASQDGTARLWHKRSGKMMYTFKDHGGLPVYTAAWCHDASLVATAGESRQICFYNMEKVEKMGAHPDYLSADMIILRIAGYPQKSDGHSGSIRKLVWSHDDAFVISGGDDRIVKVWSVAKSGKLDREMKGHQGAIHDLALSPGSGVKLITASADGTAKIWIWKTGKLLQTLKGHKGVVYSCCFTSEGGGRRCITGGHDRVINVWEASTGALLQRMDGVHRSWILGLAPRSDGLAFASASGDQTIGVWRALPLSCWQGQSAFWGGLRRLLSGASFGNCLGEMAASRAEKSAGHNKDQGGR